MKMKLSYLLALIILIPACWLTTTFFWGTLNLGESIVLMIVVALIVKALFPITRRVGHKIWIFTGLLILLTLFLPASTFIIIFPMRVGSPLDSGLDIAFTILMGISLALVVAALLLNSGLGLNQKRKDSGAGEDEGYQEQLKNTGRTAMVVIILSVLLLTKALHSFYWFMVWDTTTDSLGWLWIQFPLLGVLIASFILFIAPLGKTKLLGFSYLLLIPALIAISARAQRVDFRQLTEERAEYTIELIETYHANNGHYPEDLQELSTWHIFLIPDPVIIYGEKWCYEGGDDYYRLGYIYREHWSSPNLIGKTHKSQGDILDIQPLCKNEAAALMVLYPDNYWTFEE